MKPTKDKWLDFHYEADLAPETLDDLLDRGYFRMEFVMIKSDFYCFEDRISSVVHLRTRVGAFSPSQSQRKILSKVKKNFGIVIKKLELSPAMEGLYHLGKKVFKGLVVRRLEDFLGYHEAVRTFETWSVEIFDGSRLVAFSLFDLGKKSIYSLIALYHPDYARFSLGNATLLLEILWAAERGYDFHYPGFVFDNNDVFHYKLQAGPLEYRRSDGVWEALVPPIRERAETARLERRYELIAKRLAECGVHYSVRLNPFFGAGLFGGDGADYVQGFKLVEIERAGTGARLGIDFDPESRSYSFSKLAVEDFHQKYGDFFESGPVTGAGPRAELFQRQPLLFRSRDPNEMALHVQDFLKACRGDPGMDS